MSRAGLCHQSVDCALVGDSFGQPLQLQQLDRGERQPPVLEQRHSRLATEYEVAQVRAGQPAAAGEVVQDLVEPVSRQRRIIVAEQRQIHVPGKH